MTSDITASGSIPTPSGQPDGYVLKVQSNEAVWGEGGGGGSGIDISGGSTIGTDISGAGTGVNEANIGSGSYSKEGAIIYDSNKNIFYEASRSKPDKPNGDLDGELAFKPLGYSFFRENLEGQPPSPILFFFFQ